MRQSKYGYCDICDQDVEYDVILETRQSEYKGIKFSYVFKKAVCKHCGNQVFPVSVGTENQISRTDEYKKICGLLTSKEMVSIRKKLSLSQDRLAKLVGCGAKNIARYETGAIQIRSIDNAIRMLANKNNLLESEDLNKQFANHLNKAIREKNISIKELSNETKLSESEIINFEKGIDQSLIRLSDLFKALDQKVLITIVPNEKKSKRIGSAKKEMNGF